MRPPKGDSCGASFGSVGGQPGNIVHNRRRALIVRRHRAWLEQEVAKLIGEEKP